MTKRAPRAEDGGLSIGLFTYSTRPRGSVVHAACLAEALTRGGHDVTLYALSKAGDAFYRELACRVVLFPAGPAPSEPEALVQQRVTEMAAGLLRARPCHDVLHAEDCLAASALSRVRNERFGAPVVRTVHHVEAYTSPFLLECQRRSVMEADRVLTVSRSSQEAVRRAFGYRAPIVSNGVDVARFAVRDRHREGALRARYGVAASDRVVLSVGGVEERKNSLIALEAVASLLATRPDLHWLVAGGASLWEHAEYRSTFAARLEALPAPIRSRVRVLGPVPEAELTTLYQTSDVLLCPSLHEGFGLAVLEALAAGTPVVVSAGAPFTEYLDAASASFVEPRSPQSLAEALAALLANSALCASRARAGLAVARRHSWERVAARHAEHYAALVRGRAAHRAAVAE